MIIFQMRSHICYFRWNVILIFGIISFFCIRFKSPVFVSILNSFFILYSLGSGVIIIGLACDILSLPFLLLRIQKRAIKSISMNRSRSRTRSNRRSNRSRGRSRSKNRSRSSRYRDDRNNDKDELKYKYGRIKEIQRDYSDENYYSRSHHSKNHRRKKIEYRNNSRSISRSDSSETIKLDRRSIEKY